MTVSSVALVAGIFQGQHQGLQIRHSTHQDDVHFRSLTLVVGFSCACQFVCGVLCISRFLCAVDSGAESPPAGDACNAHRLYSIHALSVLIRREPRIGNGIPKQAHTWEYQAGHSTEVLGAVTGLSSSGIVHRDQGDPPAANRCTV